MKPSDPAKRQRSSLFSWYDGFERVEASRASKFGTQSVSFLRDRERPPSGSGDECYDVPETALSQLPQNLLFAVNLFGVRVFSSSLCRGPTPAHLFSTYRWHIFRFWVSSSLELNLPR